MTPERARELSEQAWHDMEDCKEWNAPLIKAILQACAEERADVLKNEFICARCQLRQDSTREIKHEF